MFNLIKRHLLYTIRDRSAFAMSFLSVIILIIIYKAFLGQFQIDSLKQAAQLQTVPTAGLNMTNYWLISGLVVVTAITSVVGGLSVVVDDYVTGKQLDFKISGASPIKLIISYYLAAIILGFCVTVIALIFGITIFVGFNGLLSFTLWQWLTLLGNILLSNLFAVTLTMPIVQLVKSRTGFASLSTIIGTLVGFVAGVYIAMGNLSTAIKNIMLATPFIHLNVMFKRILMHDSEMKFFQSFPKSAQLTYDKMYGNQLYFPKSGELITHQQSLLFILLWIVVLGCLNIFVNLLVAKKH